MKDGVSDGPKTLSTTTRGRTRCCSPLGIGSSIEPGRLFSSAGVCVCLCVVTLACGRNPGPAIGAVSPGASDSIFIVIENQNFYDAAVYVQFQGGTRRRLASVRAYTTERHSVRYDPSEMWFHVDFVGARFETRSNPLSLSPGETVELELTANAHRTGRLITRRRR